MTQSSKRKVKSIPMQVANDPELHRFGSLQEALAASVEPIASLIRAGDEVLQGQQMDSEAEEAASLLESA